MNDIWSYPYRLGITLFLIGGTALLTIAFVRFVVWLEKAFNKDKK